MLIYFTSKIVVRFAYITMTVQDAENIVVRQILVSHPAERLWSEHSVLFAQLPAILVFIYPYLRSDLRTSFVLVLAKL